MFLQLHWGGIYMDEEQARDRIRDCFSVADQVVAAASTLGEGRLGGRLTIVVSDLSGSCWLAPGRGRRGKDTNPKGPLDVNPVEVLTEVLGWLTSHEGGKRPGRRATMSRSKNGSTTKRIPALFEDAVELIRTGAGELGPSIGWEFLYCPSSLPVGTFPPLVHWNKPRNRPKRTGGKGCAML